MKLRICRCDRFCKIGRKNLHFQTRIKNKVHSYRTKVRYALKSGDYYNVPTEVRIGHTD